MTRIERVVRELSDLRNFYVKVKRMRQANLDAAVTDTPPHEGPADTTPARPDNVLDTQE